MSDFITLLQNAFNEAVRKAVDVAVDEKLHDINHKLMTIDSDQTGLFDRMTELETRIGRLAKSEFDFQKEIEAFADSRHGPAFFEEVIENTFADYDFRQMSNFDHSVRSVIEGSLPSQVREVIRDTDFSDTINSSVDEVLDKRFASLDISEKVKELLENVTIVI